MKALFFIFIAIVFCKSAFAAELEIGFGSCLSQKKDLKILDSILADSAEHFVFLGDVPYSNYNEYGESFESLKSAYNEISKVPSFQQILNTKKIYSIWDDHDYGVKDGGKESPFKKEAQKAFLDLYQVPKGDERRSRQGLYFSRNLKVNSTRVKMLFLDTRSFRDPLKLKPNTKKHYVWDSDEKKSILGEKQWVWLLKELAEDTDILLIMSSIQVLPTEHPFEKWMNIVNERSRLLAAITKSTAKKKLIISGDRHFSNIYRFEQEGGNPDLYEFTVSGLNKTLSKKISLVEDSLGLGAMIRQANYAVLKFYYGYIVFEYKDKNGDRILQFKL